MQQHLPRWIYASVVKYFWDNKSTYKVYVDPEKPPLERETDRAWIELKLDGPYIRPQHSRAWYDIEVNFLISAQLDRETPRMLQVIQGHFLSLIIGNNQRRIDIPVYKYGDGVDDDESYVGCLILTPIVSGDREVRVGNFQTIDIATRLTQGNLEAHYRLELP